MLHTQAEQEGGGQRRPVPPAACSHHLLHHAVLVLAGVAQAEAQARAGLQEGGRCGRGGAAGAVEEVAAGGDAGAAQDGFSSVARRGGGRGLRRHPGHGRQARLDSSRGLLLQGGEHRDINKHLNSLVLVDVSTE